MTGAATAAPPAPSPAPPSLRELSLVFLSIGVQSFGGGLSAWVRREVVQRRGWLEEQAFLSGLALCQITPGPNAVNLAVFVGATLRGRAGAFAALAGMLIVPIGIVLALGAAFATLRDTPWLGSMMTGIGAAAIGLNFATALRMTRKGVRTPGAALIVLAAAISVGLADVSLPLALLVLVPASLAFAVWRR
jgi:chromate transporter